MRTTINGKNVRKETVIRETYDVAQSTYTLRIENGIPYISDGKKEYTLFLKDIFDLAQADRKLWEVKE